jgi:DNA-binding MarR family transcriptional regulator
MVARGLLRTQPDPKHGRRILISLTPSALPLAQELQQLATEIRSSLVSGLGQDEQAVMRQGLLSMVANLDGMLVEIPASTPGGEAVATF